MTMVTMWSTSSFVGLKFKHAEMGGDTCIMSLSAVGIALVVAHRMRYSNISRQVCSSLPCLPSLNPHCLGAIKAQSRMEYPQGQQDML